MLNVSELRTLKVMRPRFCEHTRRRQGGEASDEEEEEAAFPSRGEEQTQAVTYLTIAKPFWSRPAATASTRSSVLPAASKALS